MIIIIFIFKYLIRRQLNPHYFYNFNDKYKEVFLCKNNK